MGLRVSIYRDAAYGATARKVNEFGAVEELTIANVEGPAKPTEEAPAAVLIPGNVPGAAKIVRATEKDGEWVEDKPTNRVGPMMGGTYAATSDSRFTAALRELGAGHYGAVPIHDRYETTAQYEALST